MSHPGRKHNFRTDTPDLSLPPDKEGQDSPSAFYRQPDTPALFHFQIPSVFSALFPAHLSPLLLQERCFRPEEEQNGPLPVPAHFLPPDGCRIPPTCGYRTAASVSPYSRRPVPAPGGNSHASAQCCNWAGRNYFLPQARL